MASPLIIPVVDKLFDIVGKYFPSEEERNKARIELILAEQQGHLEDVKAQLSAIIAEAQAADPYTSRARPSFLYVIYIIILVGLPMGVLSAYDKDLAVSIAVGFKAWLSAVPESMWTLFSIGYLGYTGARSIEKMKGVS